VRFGVDGWRQDAPGEITVVGFWEASRQRVRGGIRKRIWWGRRNSEV